MTAVLLGLILCVVAGMAAYVAVISLRERGRVARQDCLSELARVQGVDVAVKVGQALGWISDAKSEGDSVQIRVR